MKLSDACAQTTPALRQQDEEAAGTARGIEDAQGEGLFRRGARDEFPHRLLDDVVHDVARGVIDTAGLPHLGLYVDSDALAVRTDDLAEEALIDAAEYLDGNVVEEIGRLVIAQFTDEAGEPFVADDEGLAEVGLEEVAVEERDGGGRAAVERAKVADDGIPQ